MVVIGYLIIFAETGRPALLEGKISNFKFELLIVVADPVRDRGVR